jgi:hypothetical protein
MRNIVQVIAKLIKNSKAYEALEFKVTFLEIPAQTPPSSSRFTVGLYQISKSLLHVFTHNHLSKIHGVGEGRVSFTIRLK